MLKIRLSKDERSKARECACFNVTKLLARLETDSRADPWRGSNLGRCIPRFRSARGLAEKRVAFDALRFLCGGMFGRRECGGFVTYPPQAPVWFRNLMMVLKIDESLKHITIGEMGAVENKEEKESILRMLAEIPSILGQTGPRTKHDVTYRESAKDMLRTSIKRLEELGMTHAEITSFIVKQRPSSRRQLRHNLVRQLNDMKKELAFETSSSEKVIREGRETSSLRTLNRVRIMKEMCEALNHQSKALGMKPPRVLWADKCVARLERLNRANRLMCRRRKMRSAEKQNTDAGRGSEHGALGALH